MDQRDVDAAVAEMLQVLSPQTAEGWMVPAGPLEWTCWQTAAHIGHDLLASAGQPAAQPTDAYPVGSTVIWACQSVDGSREMGASSWKGTSYTTAAPAHDLL